METWPLSDRRNWDPAIVDRQVGVLVKPDTPIPKAMTDGRRKRPVSVTYTHLHAKVAPLLLPLMRHFERFLNMRLSPVGKKISCEELGKMSSVSYRVQGAKTAQWS